MDNLPMDNLPLDMNMEDILASVEQNAAKIWAVYAGLGGGFGGADFHHFTIGEFDEVMEEAYDTACDCYSGYEGLYGLKPYDECLEEADGDEEYAQEVYTNQMESWIEYDAVPYQQAIDDGDVSVEEFNDFIRNTITL